MARLKGSEANGGAGTDAFSFVDAKTSSLHHYFHTGFHLYRVFIFLKILQTHKEKNRFQRY